ncbi:MBL fold metallo-hydrolase [uncultured Gilvimarinus sp.]|jgi:glyoxylase-like metal-dependent hydrolase (beta-lactamase superfamily II)|uniref:MBL fold metallo-hydrolase n=1 Tax=uncultured Gilvimarinus sp. TaxID=1689143 RepID=UPI0030DA0F47
MLFRQLFDKTSSTYTYLLADNSQAVLIDPVIENTDSYITLLTELELKLVLAIDTHTHADHITALGKLRELTGCETRVGEQSKADCANGTYRDSDTLTVGGLKLKTLYTPGHTDDSYTFMLEQDGETYVFTGDTLLIRGTGRTDFQNGNARDQYQSLFSNLLTLPADTWVYPGHDYKGWMVSTIGEESAHNPRLQVKDVEEYVDLMNSLDLPNPKMMDVAVPANQACGEV